MDENDLQNHVMRAMYAYSKARNLKYTDKSFSNPQQSEKLSKFISDFCFTINNIRFYAIELKVMLDTKKLKSPDMKQWENNRYFEEKGIPIYYMYNGIIKVPCLLENADSFTDKWYEDTLKVMKISSPAKLPISENKYDEPAISKHKNVIDIFNSDEVEYNHRDVGAILQLINRGCFTNNRLLLVAYSGGSVLNETSKKIIDGSFVEEITQKDAALLVEYLLKAGDPNSAEFSKMEKKLTEEEQGLLKDLIGGINYANTLSEALKKDISADVKEVNRDMQDPAPENVGENIINNDKGNLEENPVHAKKKRKTP